MIMPEISRDEMVEDLLPLGLHKDLLDGLGDSMIKRLHYLIGWASPAFKERNENVKDKK